MVITIMNPKKMTRRWGDGRKGRGGGVLRVGTENTKDVRAEACKVGGFVCVARAWEEPCGIVLSRR